jgi:antibiotic biosynthesis monooxygenase (ABM) superfamily enzyme
VIVYEVNLVVREAIHADYRAWLAGHIEEMLALPGFVSAEILDQIEPASPQGTRALTVCYRIADRASLDRYLDEHAPRMREDGQRRFGDAFTATRRVLMGVSGER